MSSTGEWIARQTKLLLAFLTLALDAWSIWQAIKPERPIPVVGATLGTREYVAAAIVLSLTTAALLVAWSRQFWPSVRFKALYPTIAACRDDAAGISQGLYPGLPHPDDETRLSDWTRFSHRMDELRADLRRLGIRLPAMAHDKDGSMKTHVRLRVLAVQSHIGDIREARKLSALFED